MLYVVAVEGLEEFHLNIRELVFIVYALGDAPTSHLSKAEDRSVLTGQARRYPRAWPEGCVGLPGGYSVLIDQSSRPPLSMALTSSS